MPQRQQTRLHVLNCSTAYSLIAAIVKLAITKQSLARSYSVSFTGCFKVHLLVFVVICFPSVGNAQQSANSAPKKKEQSSTVGAPHSLETESFAISELNARLKNEAGMTEEQSRSWLENRVKTAIFFESANAPGEPGKIGIDSVDGKSLEMSLDRNGRGAKVVSDQLLVVATSHELRKVAEMVNTFTHFGVRQIEIRTHVFRDTADAMKAMPIRWSHIEAKSRIAESVIQSTVMPASFAQAEPLIATGKYIQRQSSPRADLPPPDGVTSATWTEASSIVERATPALYTLLSPGEYKEVLEHTKKRSSIERVMATNVVVFNGQIASVSDSVQRPFVTGVKAWKIGPEGKQQIEFAPNVTVYNEGTTMKIRPELFEGKTVRVNCQLDLCKIRSVETLAIPGVEGREDFTVQMPEVASTQFRTCLEMPIGYTLAVSSFETDQAGIKRSVVVLCQCSLRDIESK